MSDTPASLVVKEIKLSNGLTVWLNEDHNQPKVFGAVLVKAGAKDCPDTGIAHYFEHMMFKGTDKIGTIDYESEKVILDAIAAKYDELAICKDEICRLELQKEINRLSIEAAKYAIPNEFDRLISMFGGSQLNAGTSYDYTVYHNVFSPQYFAHWAELNSERLLNPVFRLFQSELETVYEEKNMYNDVMGMQAMERLTRHYFAPHPYAFPIIGSTENLKNPQLTRMRKFFEDYYVASNIGLILSGDFHTEEIMPVLEKTFSRIRSGEAPFAEQVVLPEFKGKEKVKVKLPVPFVKMMALGFRGVPANHKDKVAINIAMALLNNENGTGYLDQLSVNHKIMAAMSMNQGLNEAGILAVAIVPKLLFQSYASAEKLVWREINRIKEGDFSDEMFLSLKLEQRRNYERALEDIDARAKIMMTLYSQGKSWSEYMEEMGLLHALTKEDVARVARKYFTENYLYATKKTGHYPKNKLSKPDFAPIVPANGDTVSEYAQELKKLPVKQLSPRFVDFHKDVIKRQLAPLATLYISPNPVNRIFSLKLSYGIGFVDNPVLSQLNTYLPFLGTDKWSFKEFRLKLQVLGSVLEYEVEEHQFHIKVSGFDNYFDETVALVGEFMRRVKADEKQLKQLTNEEKVASKSFFQSSDDVSEALFQKVRFGDKSSKLTKLSLKEVKKLKGSDLLALFDRVKATACTVHYCGTLSENKVAASLTSSIAMNGIIHAAPKLLRDSKVYDRPLVYFYPDAKVSQSIIYGYVNGEPLSDMRQRHAAKLFSNYFGGDMSSLMFQEIREFRSYAYRVKADYWLPSQAQSDKPGFFFTMLSTQSDKTLDALGVLDAMIKDMPVRPEKIVPVRQSLCNAVNNSFPAFRELSTKVAKWEEDGYTSDPNEDFLRNLSGMGMDDVNEFYRSQVQGRPIVYVIVGNEKNIDMRRLSAFGQIVKVKKEEIYR